MNDGLPDLHVECSKVKMHATVTSAEVTSAAMPLAGSRAFTAGCPLERHFRDARATLLMGPTNELIKERIATHILAETNSEVH
jgi:alkylation response protein AidB-like acyl-CoA dehydrogenase